MFGNTERGEAEREPLDVAAVLGEADGLVLFFHFVQQHRPLVGGKTFHHSVEHLRDR